MHISVSSCIINVQEIPPQLISINRWWKVSRQPGILRDEWKQISGLHLLDFGQFEGGFILPVCTSLMHTV